MKTQPEKSTPGSISGSPGAAAKDEIPRWEPEGKGQSTRLAIAITGVTSKSEQDIEHNSEAYLLVRANYSFTA